MAMNYLFFDIECSNCFGGHGKICSLGYVLADSRFNVLEQKDILVNPKSKFYLRRGNGEGIELGYPEAEFFKAPDFASLYPRFKELLEDPEVIVFGHSVNNDINFLLSECVRYKQPYFTFNAYDTQILHRHFMPESKENGLGKICETFEIPVDNLHRSDYDAYLTMQVAKKICEIKHTDIEGLLHECPDCYYSVDNGVVKNHYAVISYTKRLASFAKHIKPDTVLLKRSRIVDKHFCFSMSFEKDKFKQALLLVNFIRRFGGVYSQKLSKMHYFLPYGEECLRTKNVLQVVASENITLLDEAMLLDMLGIPQKMYDEACTWSIGRLRNYGMPNGRKPKAKKPVADNADGNGNKTKASKPSQSD